MNRLQKKCAIMTVGIHLLLLVILVVGPGFFAPKPRVDNLRVLDFIPANAVDAAIISGVRDAQPPPPTTVVTPLPAVPTPPQQVVTPPTRVDTPEPVRPVVREPTPDLQRVERPVKPPEHQIRPNLTPVVRNQPRNTTRTTPRDDSQQRARAFAAAASNAAKSLKNNSFTSATKIDLPGTGSVSYASYDAIVKSVYERTMNNFLPNAIANDNEITRVRVTIASDGTVISSRIISPSGDPAWDEAVQRTLNQVTFVAPFPEGATEKERTYPISFNPLVERTLE